MRVTRVAAIQMTSTADVEQNVEAAHALSSEAIADGAQLIALPEGFMHIGPGDGKLQVAERLPGGGPVLARFSELAATHGVDLILGGFWEKSDDPARVFATDVHIGPDGAVAATYRKLHLFDVELPDGSQIRESDTISAGDTPVVTQTCAGVLGLSICYDLRFPELYRALVDRGATLLAVPAAFTLQTGKDHWHVLLRARAIEAQCYVLAPAQTGVHFGRRASYGHALVCDPWGTVLAECGEGPGYALARVDEAVVERVRASIPCLRHRRL